MGRRYPLLLLCFFKIVFHKYQYSIIFLKNMSIHSSITNIGLTAPTVQKIPKEIVTHNHTRIDDYYWLNEPKNPDVIAYLNEENEYLDKIMSTLKPLKETLFEEMKGRIKEQDESVPVKDGEYFYYVKYVEGGEYPIYCRKKENLEADVEILLDGNEMGKGKKYFSIGGYEITDNEEIIAYGVDTISRRNYTVRFKNLITGEIYKDQIKNTEGGSYAWAADNKTFFYILRDQKTLLGYQVWRHILGTDVKTDVLIYEADIVDILERYVDKY